MRNTIDTLTIKCNGIVIKARPTVWGNWYGYIGSKNVKLFFGNYEEQREDAHTWAKTIAQASALKRIR